MEGVEFLVSGVIFPNGWLIAGKNEERKERYLACGKTISTLRVDDIPPAAGRYP